MRPYFQIGLTLIELVIVMAMLALLMSVLIFLINVPKQLDKAKDAQRQSDLSTVRSTLDLYYNDANSYPLLGGFTFGSSWISGQTTYLRKVPQDPTAITPYVYQVDSTATKPQWAILYAKLANKSSAVCPLTSLTNCLPLDYAASGYNHCVLLGSVDCSYISTHNAGFPSPTPTPTPTPVPTATPTPVPSPTPTPQECPFEQKLFHCSGGNPGLGLPDRCNSIAQPDPNGYCNAQCDGFCQ